MNTIPYFRMLHTLFLVSVELEFSDVTSGDNVTLDGLIDGFKMSDFVLKVAEVNAPM